MDRCPNCQYATDFHPDPGGPNGETWWVCEYCGYTEDHTRTVIDAGKPEYRRSPAQPIKGDDLDDLE